MRNLSTSSTTETFSESITEIVSTIPASIVINETNTLRGSFGFYKGSIDMSEIRSITFSFNTPKKYDESWNANISDTEDIKGYLIGTDIVIVGRHIYTNKNCSHMFAAYNSYGDPLWSNLSEIKGLELLDTSHTDNMEMMFAFSKLTELNGIGQWDVSNVETFSHMFADCYNLKSVDFSKWNTSSAKSFDGFLIDCHSLTVLDVSNFNTKKCNQFSQMFESCTNLEHIIGLENWDVSNANYYAFSETFHRCYKLKEVNIGGWNTKPDNTARMFKDCYNLIEVDISGFDMINNLHTTEMFDNCNAIIKR